VTDAAEKMNDGIPIGGVPSEHIMVVWDKVEPLLARVVKPETGHTLDSVRADLFMSKSQLWVVGDFQGVIITTIEERPAHRVLFTTFLAGDHMDDWLSDWIDIQDQYAQHNGCVAVEFAGRKGWNKIGEKRPEWKPIRTIFRREF
jgi:hypothetical protein